MEKEAYRQHFELEETFWWFVGRREAIRSLLSPLFGEEAKQPKRRILDAGCGTGGLLGFFERYGEVWGMDLSPLALGYCVKKNGTGRLIQGSATSLPFSDGQFDLVAACDVLYHKEISDDTVALREFYRVCKRSGHLLLTDSAFRALRSPHDDFFHGIRRYTVGELRRKMKAAHFRIERISYLNMLLFPAVTLWRKTRRRASGSDLVPPPPWVNRFLESLFCREARLLRKHNLPFGTSVICLAKKV